MKLQLLEKKDLAEPEIDIRYSSMTQPLNRIVQYIRQQEYLIQGIFEKKLYQKLRVRRWQAKVPDMSRIAGKLMPRKNLDGDFHTRLDDMVNETCIAELIHVILCLAGFGCVFLWRSAPGWCVSFLYFFGNLPFILIQRYNRPMLCALARSEKHGSRKKEQI